jgi:hypothetical protein
MKSLPQLACVVITGGGVPCSASREAICTVWRRGSGPCAAVVGGVVDVPAPDAMAPVPANEAVLRNPRRSMGVGSGFFCIFPSRKKRWPPAAIPTTRASGNRARQLRRTEGDLRPFYKRATTFAAKVSSI